MNSKPAIRETPAHVSAILAEVEKQSPSIINEWQVIRHISDMLTLHILVNRQTLALSLPGQLTPDSFDNHYFYEITFMTVDKTTFKNLPSFAGVPSHAEMRARTYIRYNGLPGYFNLDIYTDNAIASKIMGHTFNYPYKTGNIKHADNYYSFDDPKHKRSVHAAWSPGIEAQTGFDKWISERNFSIQQHKNVLEKQDCYRTNLSTKHATIRDFKIAFDAQSVNEDKAHVFHPVFAESCNIVYSGLSRIDER